MCDVSPLHTHTTCRQHGRSSLQYIDICCHVVSMGGYFFLSLHYKPPPKGHIPSGWGDHPCGGSVMRKVWTSGRPTLANRHTTAGFHTSTPQHARFLIIYPLATTGATPVV